MNDPVEQLAERVVAGRLVARRVAEDTHHNLQGDAGRKTGHHRVGHEAHQRAEPQQAEDGHDQAHHQGEGGDVVRIGGVEACLLQDALRGQGDGAGERGRHQRGSGEGGAHQRGEHARVEAQHRVEARDVGVGHPFGDAEEPGDEAGEDVVGRRAQAAEAARLRAA